MWFALDDWRGCFQPELPIRFVKFLAFLLDIRAHTDFQCLLFASLGNWMLCEVSRRSRVFAVLEAIYYLPGNEGVVACVTSSMNRKRNRKK